MAIGDRIDADFVLEIGPASEPVIVSASAWATEASEAAVGTVIPNRFVTSLPLNGRNFLQLTLLAPGAVPAAVGSPGSERGPASHSRQTALGNQRFRSFMTGCTPSTRS